MHRLIALAVLLGFAFPALADDRKVSVRFLGGAKKTPLEGLQVSIRVCTGDWSADKRRKKLTDGTTDRSGAATFNLAPGRYYVDVTSEKELPYLQLPVGHKGHPAIYDRMIKVGGDAEQSFDFNLADACKLVLRAVDADTGEGISGVRFATENTLAEQWGIPILGDNLGAGQGEKAAEATDEDGYFVRYIGPRPGYTYFGWEPKGYEVVGPFEVELKSPLGAEKVEHVFKYRNKEVRCRAG